MALTESLYLSSVGALKPAVATNYYVIRPLVL
jgi:hypothetical protein